MDIRHKFLFILLSTNLIFAEPSSNPFGGQTVYQGGGKPGSFSNSGLANGIFNRQRTNPNQVGSITSQGSGLESKANDANRIAQQGSGVAIGTGSAMIGVGVPMILSTILPITIAGIILTTKGAMELAQGAASAKAARQNAKGEKTLRADEGNGKKPEINSNSEDDSSIRNRLLTPELRTALERNGTDPERFADQMLSNNGANATEENVAAALGVTPEQLAEGREGGSEKIVADELSKLSASSSLTYNQSGGFQAAFVSDQHTGNSGSNNPEIQLGGVELNSSGAVSESPASKKSEINASVETSKGSDFLSNLFLGAGGILESGGDPGKLQLMDVGIQTLPGKRNIFQVARSEYRTFGKWRIDKRAPSSRR